MACGAASPATWWRLTFNRPALTIPDLQVCPVLQVCVPEQA